MTDLKSAGKLVPSPRVTAEGCRGAAAQAGCLTGLTLTVCLLASPAAAVSWQLLTPFPPEDFQARNLAQFAADIAEATAGTLHIVIVSAPPGRGSADIVKMVSSGKAAAGEFLLAEAGDGQVSFEIDALPFLATTYQQAWALWAASAPVLQPSVEGRGMQLAFVVPRAPRGLFIDKQIWAMADLRGTRLSEEPPVVVSLPPLLGALAAAPPPPPGEPITGAPLNGMITSIPEGMARQLPTFAHTYYDLRVSLPKSAVVFNRDAYLALDAEVQRALLNASVDAQNRGWQASAAANNAGMDALRGRGLTVAAVEPEVARELPPLGEAQVREWVHRAGSEGQQILDHYRRR